MSSKYLRHFTTFERVTHLKLFKYVFNVIQKFENLAVFDKWLLTECTWMGGGYLREVVVHGVLSVFA